MEAIGGQLEGKHPMFLCVWLRMCILLSLVSVNLDGRTKESCQLFFKFLPIWAIAAEVTSGFPDCHQRWQNGFLPV